MFDTFAPEPGDLGIETLVGRKAAPIGWLIFNNPARRNAVSVEMWAAIPEVMAAFEADPEIRLVVVAGAGGQAFVSGADISQFKDQRADPASEARYSAVSGAGHAALAKFSKPTVAMIRGYCIGGGLAVALGCDLRIAAEGSRFGIPAARLGLGYAFPGLAALTALVGPAYAREIMFTARQFETDEALRMGLVNRVVRAADLEAVVADYAAMIGANAPLTLKAAKLAIAAALQDPERRDLAKVEAAITDCFASEDYAEGRTAFLEKRKPVFRGR